MGRNEQRFRTILVPLDGSAFAEQALPLSHAIAAATGGKLRLALVHELPGPPIDETNIRLYTSIERAVRKSERDYLRTIAARLRQASPIRVFTAMLGGPIGPTLAKYARDTGAGLIVMSTHGRGPLQRFWLGSVADYLVRTAAGAVLLVRPGEQAGGQAGPPVIRQILVPLDGSPLAESVLAPAAALADALGAELTLLRVVKPTLVSSDPPLPIPTGYDDQLTAMCRKEAEDYLRDIAESLGEQGVPATHAVVVGHTVIEPIVGLAQSDKGGLIALATHGRGGLQRLTLGSVADKLIRAAEVPVLVIRPTKARRRGPKRP